MTEEEALARLGRMVASDVDPTLSEDELADLLVMAKVADGEGLAPSDDDWEPTFNLIGAAAEGWRWKAGKSVPRFGVSLDGETLNRHHVYAHCLKQADSYARRNVGSIGVKTLHVPIDISE